ncbi:hypothetical protein [Halomicrobium zhouii]|uniref:hypothetical protein n=1 Tax=Halomicrobium zhouii TaxID=767519 RepID=UPI0015A5C0D7|nr:hypothetical protein [Halomicrobium zhouii]
MLPILLPFLAERGAVEFVDARPARQPERQVQVGENVPAVLADAVLAGERRRGGGTRWQ